MIYDLSNFLHRKQFVSRANKMLQKKVGFVTLTDNSQRTLSQNKYLHVLIRMLAIETGVTESYSKDIYFKTYANNDLFLRQETDPLSGEVVRRLRSTTELTVEEMNKAIQSFRKWASDNGFYLPDAEPNDDGKMEFASDKDEQAFRQGELETARLDNYLG